MRRLPGRRATFRVDFVSTRRVHGTVFAESRGPCEPNGDRHATLPTRPMDAVHEPAVQGTRAYRTHSMAVWEFSRATTAESTDRESHPMKKPASGRIALGNAVVRVETDEVTCGFEFITLGWRCYPPEKHPCICIWKGSREHW